MPVSGTFAQAPATPAPGTPLHKDAATSVEPPTYRKTVDAAIAEYDAGHFAESRALFERAHALFPNARTLRGMGMAEFELRNYVVSVQRLEQALAATVKPMDGKLRSETEVLLTRARGFVGRVRLNVAPPDANVLLNGVAVESGPTRTMVLVVGDYALEASAPGYTAQSQRLHIVGEQDISLSIQLVKALAQPVVETAVPAATADDSSLWASPWLWTAVGVVVAGTAVGVGVAMSGDDPAPIPASGGSTGVTLKAR